MKLIAIIALVLFASCGTTARYAYAPAKITVYKGKISIQPMQKFKPMPDTTIEGTIIKRMK